MTCVPGPPSFRLLDHRVGWDESDTQGLTGLLDGGGVRLETLEADPGTVSDHDLSRYFPPPRLARGCEPCEWYLATPSPPAPRLLRFGACDPSWKMIWEGHPPRDLTSIDALAVHRRLVAVIESDPGRIWVLSRDGDTLVSVFRVPEPVAAAFESACSLLVVAEPDRRIHRYDPSGLLIGTFPDEATAGVTGTLERIAVSLDGTVWLASRVAPGRFLLWRAACKDDTFEPTTLEDLVVAFPDNGLAGVGPDGFCLMRGPEPGTDGPVCFSWFSRPTDDIGSPPAPSPPRATQGQLLTGPIDSGVPRCCWHRVRIDAEVPEETTLEIAVASSETTTPPDQGVADPQWAGFPPGPPHPDDWQVVRGGVHDFLVDQPAGRYLLVRLRLTGDGTSTPRVQQVRLDFPRITSLDHLPLVYREDPRAEDFSERFLSLFDASLGELDRAVERFPTLFDVDGVPGDVLPWLGGFLDVALDPAWNEDHRRRILRAIPDLYRRRGTVGGLVEAIRLVFDFDPEVVQVGIEEIGKTRLWGALAAGKGAQPTPLHARVGEVRLFGRARARFRLDRSELGRTAVRSYGDPDLDAVNAGVHRFRVLVPGSSLGGAAGLERLRRLVEGIKPAHTVATLETGAEIPVVGTLSVGVDTRLSPPPPPVLGKSGNVRLRRGAVLRAAPRKVRETITVGRVALIASSCCPC